MNKLLLDLNNKNIHNLSDAQNELSKTKTDTNQTYNKNDFSEREYSKEELNALFDSLDDIEV